MPREEYRIKQQYTAWRKRTNRLITEKNPSGRPTPQSAYDHMRSNPYPTIITRKEDAVSDD